MMADPYINIYNNNPTQWGTDGTAVTTDGSYGNAVRVGLDAAQAESKIVKLAVRTTTGFTADNVYITTETIGDVPVKWFYGLDPEDPTSFNDSLLIPDGIDNSNYIFYAKAISSADELPMSDTSQKIKVTATIYAN
jgi:hypothetical protein